MPPLNLRVACNRAPGLFWRPRWQNNLRSGIAYFVKRSESDTTIEARRNVLKESISPNLYPVYHVDDYSKRADTFKMMWRNIEVNQTKPEMKVTLRGRIRRIRDVGSKLKFYDIEDNGTRVQILSDWKLVGGSQFMFKHRSHALRVGDIISITGYPGRTNVGELSLYATSWPKLLSACIRQLPKGLTQEQALHKRHLDLLVNPNSTKILRLRSHIIGRMRRLFFKEGFEEVQTPILSYNAGGAIARPFLTEATSAYRGRKLTLRIAPELWLKRLVIGGMDRVFEIGPQFRNEHIDATHNPEFTTCEYYEAYSNLRTLITSTQEFLSDLAERAAKLKAPGGPCTGLPQTMFDFSGEYKQIDFIPALEEAMGHPLPTLDGRSHTDITADLVTLFTTLLLPVPSTPTPARLLDKLSSHYLESQCIQPTFILRHPELLSPLAKTRLVGGRRVSQRFELFVDGKELVNAYEEENDPEEQRHKFAAQHKEDGVELDEGYLEALEYGLPPTAGWGMGVDRLIMLLTGSERINDVLAFGGLRGAVNQGGEATHKLRRRERDKAKGEGEGEGEGKGEVETDRGTEEVEEVPIAKELLELKRETVDRLKQEGKWVVR